MNYEEAARLHGRARFPASGKPIANNTRVVRIDGGGEPSFAIRLHATNVVTFEPEGSLHFRHGGWETMVTADRMSMADGVIAFCCPARTRYSEEAIFVKRGTWRYGDDGTAVRVDGHARLTNGEWVEHGETYGEYLERRAERARERARERCAERRESALDLIVGNPRTRWGWQAITAAHLRVANGVLFSGDNPVAVCYPHPEEGVQANVLTVSQRALKRTRVGLELVERASEAGCRLVFEDHGVVVAEAQNRRHA